MMATCPFCVGPMWRGVCTRCGLAIGEAKSTGRRKAEEYVRTIATSGAEMVGRSGRDTRASFDDANANEDDGDEDD